jgi:aspartyl-tRNA(Asn)/glutamyl-tRNA(Gln) amidotransferase subunit B
MPSAKNMAELASMILEGMISSRSAKDILAMIVVRDEAPMKIALGKDLLQKSDAGALKEIAQKIVDANAKVVADYKGGKEQALMSLVGQMMKETKGSANPQIAKQTLIELLARP